MTLSISRTLRTTLAVPALAALLLTGCGAAEDLAQGAQDAAADKASEVAEGAQSAAASKASELAADAVRTQVFNLVKDGSLSSAARRAMASRITSDSVCPRRNESRFSATSLLASSLRMVISSS